MKRTIASILVAGLAVAFMAGCAKAPEQEVAAAKSAIEAAKSAEADRYAAPEFTAAQDSLNAAMAEIEKQNSAFPLSRNYDHARKALTAVATAASAAQTNAVAAKEKVKIEADSAIAQTKVAIEDARGLLKKAPKGKEGKEALEAISNEISLVDSSLVEASTLVSSGDFMGARDKANAGLEKIASVSEELKTAIEKTGKK